MVSSTWSPRASTLTSLDQLCLLLMSLAAQIPTKKYQQLWFQHVLSQLPSKLVPQYDSNHHPSYTLT